MASLDLRPDCVYSAFVSPLVGFFDWGFQPHLDQMQHGSIDYPASYRLHQLGVWNTIEGSYDTLPIISTFRSE